MPQVKVTEQNKEGDIADVHLFEQILEVRRLDNAIAEAEAEYNESSILLDARERLETLRRQYFE